jgi:branched-chain amino acid transport system ATP-binding protein
MVNQIHNLNGLTFTASFYISKFSCQGRKVPLAKKDKRGKWIRLSDDVIIKVENLSLAFGGVQALYNVSTQSLNGEILAVIGPNGAGKTCLLNCISRFYTPQEGRIVYKGQDIVGAHTHTIAKMGIARTFQNIELFKGMTVLDNIKLGRHKN